LGFRVGTPPARKGAAFKEYRRPDTRPVMETEFLDIKKESPDTHATMILQIGVFVNKKFTCISKFLI
jgi:hypothetical protein